MAAADPTHDRPDLWYFPSEYAMRPAIPLHYSTGASPSPVPLTDLFPVFASSPSIHKSTPVPIVDLCTVSYSHNSVDPPLPPDAAATSLSLCLFDKCQDALAQVSNDGGVASLTYEALVSVVGGGERGAVGAELRKHFNSYNAVEECAIRHCPTEYFVAHSSICISLRHPYFTQRNIFLPAFPPRHSPAELFSKEEVRISIQRNIQMLDIPPHAEIFENLSRDEVRIFSDYLSGVRSSSQRTSDIPDGDDLGVRLPALPAGFPCDSARADQATGAIVRTTSDPTSAAIDMRMTSAGTWITTGDKDDQWALSYNATATAGVVHAWMAKSTMFRGPHGMGEKMADRMRGLVATVPANLYSLGHCPRSTGKVARSKLTGEACEASIECVFSMCVNGKCAETASGKQLDAATAFQSMERTVVERRDEEQRETAAWWMMLVGAVVGGLVALRLLVLANRRLNLASEQAKWRRADAMRRGADEPPAFAAAASALTTTDGRD